LLEFLEVRKYNSVATESLEENLQGREREREREINFKEKVIGNV